MVSIYNVHVFWHALAATKALENHRILKSDDSDFTPARLNEIIQEERSKILRTRKPRAYTDAWVGQHIANVMKYEYRCVITVVAPNSPQHSVREEFGDEDKLFNLLPLPEPRRRFITIDTTCLREWLKVRLSLMQCMTWIWFLTHRSGVKSMPASNQSQRQSFEDCCFLRWGETEIHDLLTSLKEWASTEYVTAL